MLSIVRTNLLTVLNYTPYCGSLTCCHNMPRSVFNGQQFQCGCGWRSSFEDSFINEYKQAQAKLKQGAG